MTLAAVVLLLIQDAWPRWFPVESHEFLAAFSLATITAAYLIYRWTQRRRWMELAKPILLAAAFFFWAANQLWPRLPQAGLFNDIAIGLFVLDVFLVIAGGPEPAKSSEFADAGSACGCECQCSCEGCRRRTA